MNRLEALVSLNRVAGIGSIRLKKLLKFFHKPENILKAPAEKLDAISGIGPKIACQIAALKKEDLAKEFAQAASLGLKIITLEDKQYPKNLKNIPDPPIILYVKGDILDGDNFSIGIVGSRRASFYGLNNATNFAFDLAIKGVTIVSGMARGIDTAAHQGALKAQGRTLAVIGSGFKHIYPAENIELAEEISKQGAVISEFPVNALPLPINFPRRNRVISGLSLGTLVVEAAQNSGALITADFALEQGREVFCLPGRIDSPSSFGTNELIKQGAKLVSNTDEILEEFIGYSSSKQASAVSLEKPKTKADLSSGENEFYSFISTEPVHIDELIDKTNLDITCVSDILLSLRLKKVIRELPGKYYIRINEK